MWYNPGIYLGGAPGRKSRTKMRKWENDKQFQITFVRLVNEALQRYSIEGLPETVSERVVLQSLLWYGCVVFYEYEGNLFSLPGVPTGNGFNIYGDPGSAWVYSVMNGQFNKEVKLYIPGSDEAAFLKRLIGDSQKGTPTGVIVWENKMRYPFIDTVWFFSKCIADCYRTLDVTRYWLKRPLLLTGPEEYSEDIKRLIDGMDENPNAVYIKELVGVDKQTTLLNTNSNGQNLTDVTGILEWYENKFRELCGLDSNSQIDKKGENLITAELTVNDQYQQMQLDKSIEEIQKGLDYANRFFGLDMSVTQNKATEMKMSGSGENKEGGKNGADKIQ